MTSAGAQWNAVAVGEERMPPGSAPSKQTLATILAERRMHMLAELRDIEQALEALERTPDLESTLQRVMKFMGRKY